MPADAFRRHDLIGGGVLQHAVLVDAGFMREGVAPDDRLVRLHVEAGDAWPAACEVRRMFCVSRCRCCTGTASGRVRIAITTSSSEALPARSPMPLMVHSICRAPARDRGQRVGDRQAQIVVVMGGEDHLVGARHALAQHA